MIMLWLWGDIEYGMTVFTGERFLPFRDVYHSDLNLSFGKLVSSVYQFVDTGNKISKLIQWHLTLLVVKWNMYTTEKNLCCRDVVSKWACGFVRLNNWEMKESSVPSLRMKNCVCVFLPISADNSTATWEETMQRFFQKNVFWQYCSLIYFFLKGAHEFWHKKPLSASFWD